jgi:DNA-binding response OmpR family regulator
MRLLIAEDDPFFQKVLQQVLGADYEIVAAYDGDQAWALLQAPSAPRLAILDWVMPGLSGPQVCRKVRGCASLSSTYLIILTAKNNEADIVSGLRAGADDYITKPPLPAELRARVRVGERVLELQTALEEHTAFASRGLDPVNIGGVPLTACPTHRKLLDQEHSRGIEVCTRQHCEPADCCATSCEAADSFGHRLLTSSVENDHPHR